MRRPSISRRAAVITASVALALVAGGVAGRILLRKQQEAAASIVDATTLTILDGSVTVQRAAVSSVVTNPLGNLRFGALQLAHSGDTLEVGDRVQVGDRSHAVVTYVDGSTTTLEPSTKLTITRLTGSADDSSGPVHLAFQLLSGSAWSHVIRTADAAVRFDVSTAAATAVVRGTEFNVAVDNRGQMEVESTEGTVDIGNGQGNQPVEPGYLAVAMPGQPPQPARPAPPPRDGIRIGLGSGADIYVCDPIRRCVGYYPDTKSVLNYVPRAWYSGVNSQPQVLILPNPPEGAYRLMLPAIEAGPLQLSIATLRNGTLVDDQEFAPMIAAGQTLTTTIRASYDTPTTTHGLLSLLDPPRAEAASNSDAALHLQVDPNFKTLRGRLPSSGPQTRRVAEAAKKIRDVRLSGAIGSGQGDLRGALGAGESAAARARVMQVHNRTLLHPGRGPFVRGPSAAARPTAAGTATTRSSGEIDKATRTSERSSREPAATRAPNGERRASRGSSESGAAQRKPEAGQTRAGSHKPEAGETPVGSHRPEARETPAGTRKPAERPSAGENAHRSSSEGRVPSRGIASKRASTSKPVSGEAKGD
ncbi:MAG: FecR domain-containing protein [Chloroflexota bacterium]|nr:FecR domain-containing protein [Chloroflexota bacterium]